MRAAYQWPVLRALPVMASALRIAELGFRQRRVSRPYLTDGQRPTSPGLS